jgi:hypothetical protein
MEPSSTKYVTAESGRLVFHYEDYGSTNGGALLVWLCDDHSLVGINGYTLTARVQLVQQMTQYQSPPNDIRTYGASGRPFLVATQNDPVGYTWYDITGTVTNDSSMIEIAFNFSQTFTGTILVEEVKLTPL